MITWDKVAEKARRRMREAVSIFVRTTGTFASTVVS